MSDTDEDLSGQSVLEGGRASEDRHFVPSTPIGTTLEPTPKPILIPPSGNHPPDLLQLGGPEAFESYRVVFLSLYCSKPIIDPKNRLIVFEESDCEHVCYCEDRFDKQRKLHEGEKRSRDQWDQSRAEHILWIFWALTTPSFIVRNNQQPGNQAYLLGYPKNNPICPSQRFYVSVKPLNKTKTRLKFKTAYTISREQWDKAIRSPRGQRDRDHVLYRATGQRY